MTFIGTVTCSIDGCDFALTREELLVMAMQAPTCGDCKDMVRRGIPLVVDPTKSKIARHANLALRVALNPSTPPTVITADTAPAQVTAYIAAYKSLVLANGESMDGLVCPDCGVWWGCPHTYEDCNGLPADHPHMTMPPRDMCLNDCEGAIWAAERNRPHP